MSFFKYLIGAPDFSVFNYPSFYQKSDRFPLDTPLEDTGVEIYTPDEIINFKDGRVTLFEY